MTSPPRAWAEIDLAALDDNLAFAREHSGLNAMAILKAGAYGHGLLKIAKHLDCKGLPYFGVANVREARDLTKANIKTPIYLLGPTFPQEREEVIVNGWTPCLSSFEDIAHFSQLALTHKTTLTAHLALDTGMGRGGFLPHQLLEAVERVTASPGIRLTGIGSHLPSADEDPEFTKQQFAQFDSLMHQIELLPPSPQRQELHLHLSNSAGLLDYQSMTTNLIRPGLLLYGVSPLPQWQGKLRPVMTLKSRISVIRNLPAGHGVSYGRSSILEKETSVATIGIGYGDGLPRAISGKGAYVLVEGRPAPLLGRVTMDQIMVDVSELPGVASGDEVEIFGQNLPVTQLAEWADTISWEILTRITPRVERIFQESKTPNSPAP